LQSLWWGWLHQSRIHTGGKWWAEDPAERKFMTISHLQLQSPLSFNLFFILLLFSVLRRSFNCCKWQEQKCFQRYLRAFPISHLLVKMNSATQWSVVPLFKLNITASEAIYRACLQLKNLPDTPSFYIIKVNFAGNIPGLFLESWWRVSAVE